MYLNLLNLLHFEEESFTALKARLGFCDRVVPMDFDIWSAICKRQQQTELSEHSYTDGFVTLEDLGEEDGEAPEDFACPFCFKDFDIEFLCHHIHDEHCFQINSRWLCPICSAKIGKDVLRHITLEHGYLCKARRRSSHNGGILSDCTPCFQGKESKDGWTHYFYTGATMNASSDSSCVSLDPLLSCFVYNMACSEAKKQPATSLSSGGSLQKSSTSNVEVITSPDERKRFEEVSGRVMFVQHLVLSTILGDEF